mgnify:CR=1 FL=1
MHTYQIAEFILQNYKNEKLSDERVAFLQNQANEQLKEIATDALLYERFLKKIDIQEDIDPTLLWMLFMSNEDICCDYIDAFGKKYREIIPVSDIADLLIFAIYLDKIQKKPLDGFSLLLGKQTEGLDEADQYAFTNVLLFVQKSKEVEMEF